MRLARLIPRPLAPVARRIYRAVRRRPDVATSGGTGPGRRRAPAPPPVRSREELHAFWRDPDDVNVPQLYAIPVARSRFLVDLVEWYCTPNDRILEIGPNVGRNLEHLRLAGYERLEGIEISDSAVAALGATYPDLAARVAIHNAPVEDVIRDFAGSSFELVFTMAVLEHIHPDSEWIFGEMVRICRRVLITIEDEGGRSARHVPRNYRTVFEGLGLVQVAEIDPLGLGGLPREFRARVFVKKD